MRDHRRVEVLGDPWSMLVLRDVIFGRSSARCSATPVRGGMTRPGVARERIASDPEVQCRQR
jgi:hypothetical protein